MRPVSCGLVIALALFVHMSISVAARGEDFRDPAFKDLFPNPKMRCGADALYLALKYLDKDVSYRSLLESCEIDEKGTSLSRLEQVTQGYSVEAMLLNMQPSAFHEVLRRYPSPLFAICHLREGHFVLVFRGEGERIVHIDTSRTQNSARINPREFQEFSGSCLFLSATPIELQKIQAIANSSLHFSGKFALLSVVAGCLSFFSGFFVGGCRRRNEALRQSASIHAAETTKNAVIFLVGISMLCGCDRERVANKMVSPAHVGMRSEVEVGDVFFVSDSSSPTFSVVVNNDSGEEVPIQGIVSSCGCSSAWMDVQSIPANTSADLHVKMKPGIAGARRLLLSIGHGKDAKKTVVQVEGASLIHAALSRPACISPI